MDEANPDAERANRAPWTIKNMDVETRQLITRCAAKRGVPVAEWVANAARNQARIEAGDAVFPPGQTERPNGQTRADLERLAEQLGALAAAGVPVRPADAARLTLALVRHLPVARTANRGQTLVADGQTRLAIGQTNGAEESMAGPSPAPARPPPSRGLPERPG